MLRKRVIWMLLKSALGIVVLSGCGPMRLMNQNIRETGSRSKTRRKKAEKVLAWI